MILNFFLDCVKNYPYIILRSFFFKKDDEMKNKNLLPLTLQKEHASEIFSSLQSENECRR
jgi:hypothetical protein